MTKKKLKKQHKKRNSKVIPKIIVEKKQRRTLRNIVLSLTVATSISALSFFSYNAKPSGDIYFFPENHDYTPKDIAVKLVDEYYIQKVAIEGLPKGRITLEKLAEYEHKFSELEKDVERFKKTIFEQISSIEKTISDLDRLSRATNMPIDERINLGRTYRELINNLTQIYVLLNPGEVGTQIRYCRPLLEKGVELYGIENTELLTAHTRNCAKSRSSIFEKIMNDMILSLNEYRAYNNDASKIVDDIMKDIFVLKTFWETEFKNKGIYSLDEEKDEKQDRELGDMRSRSWMDYLKDITPVMVIFGVYHTDLCVEIAENRGEKTIIFTSGVPNDDLKYSKYLFNLRK